MKNCYLRILVFFIALSGIGEASARKTLLPFGYFSHEPWNATYQFVANEGDPLESEWFAKDFDDSGWKTIKGPVSVEKDGLPYYNTIWEGEYGTTYVRRHFNISSLENIEDVIFYCLHDDSMTAYLNGVKIYDERYYRNLSSGLANRLSDEVRALLVEGDNVLATVVADSGGVDAYVDFGIYGFSIENGTFDSSEFWTGNFERTSYNGNIFGYLYGNGMSCERELENMPAGLYRLSANACGMEYYDNTDERLRHSGDEIPARLFINSNETPVPSAFSDPSDESGYYTIEVDGKYVPYYVEGTSRMFEKGNYSCHVWAVYNPEVSGNLSIGLKGVATDDINRWVAWDNLDLDYFSENTVETMLDSIVKLSKEVDKYPMERTLRDKVMDLAGGIGDAKDFEAKSKVLADIMNYETAVRRSVGAYIRLAEAQSALKAKLDGATAMTSPASVSEGTELLNAIQTAYKEGAYGNDDVDKAIADINDMVRRLGFTYLDIKVDVPGSMGDSILKCVENFADVMSIKISGKLDDEDIKTIKERLSQIREIDMTGVNMKSLPAEMFFRRSLIESIKLPASLTEIGDKAMYECTNLKSIEMPENLSKIGNESFYRCISLELESLPEGLDTMGEYAFAGCSSIIRIKLPSTLKIIPGYAFYDNSNITTVEFAEGLTHINYNAFYSCIKLDNLKFPTSLYYIGGNAFAYNSSLSSIEFNEGLYQIADNAFYDCDALTEVTLPSTLVLANQSPFDYCDNLVKVTCLSMEPPYMTDQIPYGLDMDGRELYVPALSVNLYKQTTGWDRFPTIKPIDYLPETINVLGNVRLTLPEDIPADYKPDVTLLHDSKGEWYTQYGSLTVNGEGTLSIKDFSLGWDPSNQYDYGDREYDGYLIQNYNSLVTNSVMRADKVSVDLFPRNNAWTFISFPFDVNVSDIEPIRDGSTSWVIRRYDGSLRAAGKTGDTWVKVGDDETLHAGEGYIIQTSRYLDNYSQYYSGLNFKALNNGSKNNIFRTDNAVVALSDYPAEFAHNRGWNLIGNPYPCYYDTRFMDFTAPITVWNIYDNTYNALSPVDDSYVLCPGEAFFVQRPVDSGEITFSNEGRQTNRSAREIEASVGTRSSVFPSGSRHIFNLNITDGVLTDRTRIVVNEDAASGYESDKDAGKFRSSDTSVPQLFSLADGVEYAINERPLGEGVVPLGIHVGKSGLLTIAFEEISKEFDVILEDIYTGEKVNIPAGGSYTFYSEDGDYPDRFQIHISLKTTGIDVVGNDDENEDDGAYYTIEGIKVTNPVEGGIYIRNGKKIILKK